MSAKICRKCNTKIHKDYLHCKKCYDSLIDKYHKDKEVYKSNLKIWNSLSIDEQKTHHQKAEKQQLQYFAVVAVLISIAVSVFSFYNSSSLTAVIISILSILIITAAVKNYIIVGRIARVITFTAVYFFVIMVVSSLFLNGLKTEGVIINEKMIYGMEALISVVFSTLQEIGGGFHASAAPAAPKKPKR